MARRRRSRQRRRADRRTPAGVGERAAPPPPAPTPKSPPAEQDVSWTGLLGGFMGFLPMTALALTIAVSPPEVGAAFAAVPALMAGVYVPAMWASVARTDRRATILRGSVIASLVLALTGSFVFGFVVLFVLAPATALLWVASGGMRRGR